MFSRNQARAAGVSDSTIARRVASGDWVRVMSQCRATAKLTPSGPRRGGNDGEDGCGTPRSGGADGRTGSRPADETLAEAGWGAKRIAHELGIARNTVRRYLRGGEAAVEQVRRTARRLDANAAAKAVALFEGAAEGNAVVVQQMLADGGVEASVRTVQRAVEETRREAHAAAVASVRFETAPGRQPGRAPRRRLPLAPPAPALRARRPAARAPRRPRLDVAHRQPRALRLGRRALTDHAAQRALAL